jgi:uncharacterized membrane protein YbjE (DUF340 family)
MGCLEASASIDAGLLLGYHADAEIARAETIARIVLFVAIALLGLTVGLVRRPELPGRNLRARLALGIAAVGIAAWLLWRLVPNEAGAGGSATAWYALSSITMLAAVSAPAVAIAAFHHRAGDERWLTAAALSASLVLPAAGIGSIVACMVTDACFH